MFLRAWSPSRSVAIKLRTCPGAMHVLNITQLTPFVTKRAEPKRSIYTKKIERNGRKVTAPRALEGQDFLNLWSERNGPEVLQERKKIAERERIEAMAEMAEASETKSRNSTPVG